MKVRSLHLSIPKPCREDWDKMTPTEKGRHCQSCKKEVIDFSTLSKQQILDLFSKNSSGICGRFRIDQVTRQLFLNVESTKNYWPKIGLLAASLLLAVPGVAQEKEGKKEKTEQGIQPFYAYPQLKGLVINEEGEALVGASVLQKGRSVGTVTDLNGKFVTTIFENEKDIWVSYVGYRTQRVQLKEKNAGELKIVMQKGVRLQKVVVTAPQIETTPIRGDVSKIEVMGELVKLSVEARKVKRSKKLPLSHEAKIKVFPNPFISQIQIEFGSIKKGIYQLSLITSQGRHLYDAKLLLQPNEHVEIDLTSMHLPAGVYWLKLRGKKEAYQQQLIKVNR